MIDRYIEIETLSSECFVVGEGGDEELWLFKRPIEIRQSGTSPFFEGEAELQNVPNIHQQKNSSLERTYPNSWLSGWHKWDSVISVISNKHDLSNVR